MRDVGPPEQSHRDLRRPLVQPRPSAAPLKKSKPSQTQFVVLLCLPNHTSTKPVTTSLTSSIAVSPSLLPVWGFGSALAQPRDPKSDSLAGLAGAGENNLTAAAALWGGSLPSLASLGTENHDYVDEVSITTTGAFRSHARVVGLAFYTVSPHPSSAAHTPTPTDQRATAANPCSSVSRGE